jgi:hypothetical protein
MAAVVTVRYRLNVRLPDAEKKYRDELTQEAEIQLNEESEGTKLGVEELTRRVLAKAEELRDGFYVEAKRLGATDYTEEAQ